MFLFELGFIHTFSGHSSNLAVCDTIKKCKLTWDALDTAYKISKLKLMLNKTHRVHKKQGQTEAAVICLYMRLKL